MISGSAISISCSDCSLRCTTACDDCVVTFVLHTDDQLAGDRVAGNRQTLPGHIGSFGADAPDALVFDLAEQRVVRWFSNAGLLPELLYEEAV